MDIKHNSSIAKPIPGYLLGEKISESALHVFYSAIREKDQQEVVIKTLIDRYPKKEDVASLRREYHILTKLQFDGIVKVHELVPFGNGNWGIVMEKFGISLREYLTRRENNLLPIEQFFTVAIPLVRLIGNLHEKRIIHKDIKPANILIDPETGNLRLIDFASSTELSREQPNFTLAKYIVGSLPYMSPEQTGRMNRDVDFRTDYYSLGITFYQMLTGQLPFTANDALEWVHCHISRQPIPANKVNRKVPAALADVIAKLISKNAEARYQSSYGLAYDLEKCSEQIRKGFFEFSFELAQADVFHTFQIPQKLFGREKELDRLELNFDNVCRGSVEFCLVSGYSGVGKSVLVQELGISIVKKRGYLISGKFEQFKQNIAYAAFAKAFRNLIYQLLGEPQESLDRWSIAINQALGSNGQLLIDLIPELELIIGSQPPVQELTPAETQNRFLMLLQSFVKVFATADHPLVLFLDDLQWSDIPTLNLIQRLAITQELGHLFIIGAYRDNAVDATHPLTLTIGEIQNKRFVENLHLEPLSLDAVNQIAMGTLLCDEQRAKPLSQVIFEKTAGNPFFTIELLKSLNVREIIYFNSVKGKWDWDIEAVKKTEKSDNVVDLLVARQSRLHAATQHVLQLAACIGATFDLETLAIIHESTMQKTAEALDEALRANMVIPLSENYKFVGLSAPFTTEYVPDIGEEERSNELNSSYRFQHDRVQQAAYSMIAPEKRQALHLSIGRLILQHTNEEKLDEVLMDVVGHLNEGRALVSDASDSKALADLNLKAGIKAKQSSAYEAALNYLKTGYELLNSDAWQVHYDLTWKLSEEIQHCTYLIGDWHEADHWTESMLQHSKTSVEKALVLSARTRQYATIGKMRESIRAACEGLAFLGFEFRQDPTPQHVAEETKQVAVHLKGRAIADLINMPSLEDTKAKIASQLMMETFAAAFLSGSGIMFPYLVLKSVNLALRYGNSPETAFAYAAYGMLLCGLLDDSSQGYEYGKLGVSIIEKFNDITLKSRIIYVYTMFVHHWSNHWATMTPWFRKGIEAGYQSGDLLYLAYSAQDCIIWDPQLDLETASNEQRKLLKIVKECEYQDSYDSGTLFLQMQLNFRGLTESKYSLTDSNFNESDCVNGMMQRHFMTGIANYHIYKAEIHFLYNDAKGALPHVQELEKKVSSVMSLPQLVRLYILSFLVYSTLLRDEKEEEQSIMLDKMHYALAKITRWARQCAENFEHLQLFMEAELAGFSGNIAQALTLYEQSIAAAKKNSFIRDEAMANEMAARFLLRTGLTKAAEGYLQASRYLYYRWGATRKVGDMAHSYPSLSDSLTDLGISAEGQGKTEVTLHEATISNFSSELLDMNSVFKASQTISGELVLEKLLKATLKILLENAGAQKGFLVENTEGKIVVLAQNDEVASVSDGTTSTLKRQVEPLFPVSLINTAFRTSEAIVLDNASKINPFSSDPYIIRKKPLSVMCVPLPLHNQWRSAVYLENNLTHNAFSEERVKIIKLLAGQAAISIANARIYEAQEKLLKAQQRFVPIQFLKNLGHKDIATVELGESVSMEMSVMFSDLIGFTSMVEQLSPHDVIELLNKYYSTLGIPITETGGFIDSYAGDEIMALFPVQAQQAVAAGVKMCDALRRFNGELTLRGRPPLNMGLGVNTGPLVLGTMGGLDRMQCSVLGDTVNLASRIEQLTRVYHAQFLIGENTYRSLLNPDAFSIRMVDYVAVKGKAMAITLYEVLDALEDDHRKAKEATKEQLSSGMNAYIKRDFALAHVIFSDLSKFDAADPVPSIFLSRCERYMKQAPPESWQGYETLVQK
ncbi:AAA family ATPase [Spirosoma sp.]|uniref:AAA family ATPase n=1 Tax=Spirosoma sp. TaxID=1899569 RepID=UPI0026186F44|nr:AAA family ATPase [Spirosoma sp.]MCX6214756.1 AAA family ATPase [Spirosoma sp.]